MCTEALLSLNLCHAAVDVTNVFGGFLALNYYSNPTILQFCSLEQPSTFVFYLNILPVIILRPAEDSQS